MQQNNHWVTWPSLTAAKISRVQWQSSPRVYKSSGSIKELATNPNRKGTNIQQKAENRGGIDYLTPLLNLMCHSKKYGLKLHLWKITHTNGVGFSVRISYSSVECSRCCRGRMVSHIVICSCWNKHKIIKLFCFYQILYIIKVFTEMFVQIRVQKEKWWHFWKFEWNLEYTVQ